MWRSAFLALVAILAVGLVAGYYLYLHKDQQPSFINEPENSTAGPTSPKDGQPGSPTADHTLQNGHTPADRQTPPTSAGTEEDPTSPKVIEDSAGAQQAEVVKENSPQYFRDEIEAFYAHLDQQDYLLNFGVREQSRTYFSKLLQKLADNPPIVLRETDNLYTLLKNTSHFFRVLGKNNIRILKGIVDKDQPRLEKILNAYYSLSKYSGRLPEEFGLSIPPESLTAYAGYFLNSMGGRLYLFRRAPGTRMLVNYYAILIIDHANSDGNQPLGIDLRPAIGALINEMEDGGRSLQFRQQYLEILYRLQEKYN